MAFDLTPVPADFGKGGSHLSEGSPRLGELLAEHHEAITSAGDQLDAAAGTSDDLNGRLQRVEGHALLTTGTPGELASESVDDSGLYPGTLASTNGELGVFVGVRPDLYGYAVEESPSPMELLGRTGDKVWVRIDKLSRPLKSHETLYVGVIGSPLSTSGLTAPDAFAGAQFMGDMFGNSLDGVNPVMQVILTSHAVSPFPPAGDFGGACLAEAFAAIAAFDVVRIRTDGKAVPALADSDANLALVFGLARNRALSPGSPDRKAVIVAWRDQHPFNPETSIVFAPGDPMYVSASEAGKVTNVAPTHARQVGVCTSNTESGVFGVLRGLA